MWMLTIVMCKLRTLGATKHMYTRVYVFSTLSLAYRRSGACVFSYILRYARALSPWALRPVHCATEQQPKEENNNWTLCRFLNTNRTLTDSPIRRCEWKCKRIARSHSVPGKWQPQFLNRNSTRTSAHLIVVPSAGLLV